MSVPPMNAFVTLIPLHPMRAKDSDVKVVANAPMPRAVFSLRVSLKVTLIDMTVNSRDSRAVL